MHSFFEGVHSKRRQRVSFNDSFLINLNFYLMKHNSKAYVNLEKKLNIFAEKSKVRKRGWKISSRKG